MRYVLGLGAILLAAGVAAAASWTCDRHREAILPGTYLVAAHCRATGTYTTGGDLMGEGGTNVQLCNSGARHVRIAMVSATSNEAGAKTYVAAWDHSTAHITLATAGPDPTADKPLVQAAAGTVLDGFTIRTLAFCD
jgi:hypothetical protein